MSDSLPFAATLIVRDRCLCLAAQRSARALARRFDTALRPFGLTNGQFSLLMALNRPQPPRISELAPFLAMDRTTLTAALKVLSREGLIDSAADPQDRRSRHIRLSPAGHARLLAALPAWQQAHDALDQQLRGAGTDPAVLHHSLNAAARPPATE